MQLISSKKMIERMTLIEDSQSPQEETLKDKFNNLNATTPTSL